jgi:hypothetical protein
MIGEFYFEDYKKQGRKGDTNMENKLKSFHAEISLMLHHTHETTKTRQECFGRRQDQCFSPHLTCSCGASKSMTTGKGVMKHESQKI